MDLKIVRIVTCLSERVALSLSVTRRLSLLEPRGMERNGDKRYTFCI